MRTGPTVGMGVRCQSQGYGRVWGLPGHPAPSDLPQQMWDPTQKTMQPTSLKAPHGHKVTQTSQNNWVPSGPQNGFARLSPCQTGSVRTS